MRMAGARAGIQISIVTAKHDNAVPVDLLTGTLSTDLAAQGIVAELGDPVGYIVTFTNGLTVYLSGDTGQTADMAEVVRKQYHAQLAVLNIGDNFTTGPEEAAYAANNLIQPESVIPSHVNEVATNLGMVVAGSRTAEFMRLARAHVYLPLSGRTMQFDQRGRCTAGCN